MGDHTQLCRKFIYWKKKKRKKNQQWNSASWFPIVGLFPVALMQSCGLFPPPGRFGLCGAAQLALECAAEPQQPPAMSCSSAGPCSPEHGHSQGRSEQQPEGDVPPLSMALVLEVENMWRNIFFQAEADGSGHGMERMFLLCCAPNQTHLMSQCQDCTEFRAEENKWKSRMTEGSIRSDTPKVRETSGRNVSHTSLHVCKHRVLVKKGHRSCSWQ